MTATSAQEDDDLDFTGKETEHGMTYKISVNSRILINNLFK